MLVLLSTCCLFYAVVYNKNHQTTKTIAAHVIKRNTFTSYILFVVDETAIGFQIGNTRVSLFADIDISHSFVFRILCIQFKLNKIVLQNK